jgi:hypothetical protein
MLQIILGAIVLVCLLKVAFGEDVAVLSALFLSFCTLVGMGILVYLLQPLVGDILALLLGGGITACGLGAAISYMYGAPLKTATWISAAFLVIYIVLSIVINVGFQLLLRANQ